MDTPLISGRAAHLLALRFTRVNEFRATLGASMADRSSLDAVVGIAKTARSVLTEPPPPKRQPRRARPLVTPSLEIRQLCPLSEQQLRTANHAAIAHPSKPSFEFGNTARSRSNSSEPSTTPRSPTPRTLVWNRQPARSASRNKPPEPSTTPRSPTSRGRRRNQSPTGLARSSPRSRLRHTPTTPRSPTSPSRRSESPTRPTQSLRATTPRSPDHAAIAHLSKPSLESPTRPAPHSTHSHFLASLDRVPSVSSRSPPGDIEQTLPARKVT